MAAEGEGGGEDRERQATLCFLRRMEQLKHPVSPPFIRGRKRRRRKRDVLGPVSPFSLSLVPADPAKGR